MPATGPVVMSRPVRVVVADDHPLIRHGLGAVLAGMADMELVGSAGTGQDAIDVVRAKQPDVVVMDVDMPGLDGIAATRILRREAPATRVLIFSLHREAELVAAAVRAGTHGYVLKGDDSDALVRALRSVAAGHAVFGGDIAAAVLTCAGSPRTQMETPAPRPLHTARIHMCGDLCGDVGGRPMDLPGRKGRLAFGYLVAHRKRPVDRDELLDVLWPERPPVSPDAALSVVLARLRRGLGDSVLTGR